MDPPELASEPAAYYARRGRIEPPLAVAIAFRRWTSSGYLLSSICSLFHHIGAKAICRQPYFRCGEESACRYCLNASWGLGPATDTDNSYPAVVGANVPIAALACLFVCISVVNVCDMKIHRACIAIFQLVEVYFMVLYTELHNSV
jgi:hypothetical protein